jgi:hypothetical protein
MFGQTSEQKHIIVDNDREDSRQLHYLIVQMNKDPLLKDLLQCEVVLAVVNSA